MKKDIAPQRRSRKNTVVAAMLAAVIVMAFVCLFVGSSNMSLGDAFAALAKKGSSANNRIIWNIRIPRVLAAVIAGAGLSASGLVMQTNLNNPMASPSTLGVSNAAVFGANLSIIAFSGGFLSTGNNVANFAAGANPYATSLMAFIFSTLSILLILGLCRMRSFSPNVVVLAGLAVGDDDTPVLRDRRRPVRRGHLELRRPRPRDLQDGCDNARRRRGGNSIHTFLL